MKCSNLLTIVLLGLSTAALADEDVGPSGRFVITGVTVEVGDGTVLEDTTVVVDRGVIQRVGGAAPTGLAVIDGAGKVLSPGFIETRTQLGVFEVMLEDSTVDWELQTGSLRPAFRVADGFNPASTRIPIERKGGVTDAILAPSGGILAGQGAAFSLTGWPADDGARRPSDLSQAAMVAGAPIPGRPVAMFGTVHLGAKPHAGNSKGGVWLKLRTAVVDTLTYRKSRAAYERGDLRPLSMSKADLEALIPVVEGRLPLVLAVEKASDILSALRFVDEMKPLGARLSLVIAGGAEAWKVSRDLASRKVPVVVTPSAQTPHSFDAVEARDDNAALLQAGGVTVVLSTHNWDNNVRRLRQEAGIATAWGLPRAEAIRGICQRPAEVFGLKGLGLVKKGYRANLVLWEGDPLELDVLPVRMWIDGVAQSLSSRQLELARKYGAGRHGAAADRR